MISYLWLLQAVMEALGFNASSYIALPDPQLHSEKHNKTSQMYIFYINYEIFVLSVEV